MWINNHREGVRFGAIFSTITWGGAVLFSEQIVRLFKLPVVSTMGEGVSSADGFRVIGLIMITASVFLFYHNEFPHETVT